MNKRRLLVQGDEIEVAVEVSLSPRGVKSVLKIARKTKLPCLKMPKVARLGGSVG